MSPDPTQTIAVAEDWFVRQGLPYFVDDERAAARRASSRGRLLMLAGVAIVTGVAAGLAVGWFDEDPTNGVAAGTAAVGLVAAWYAATALRAWPIASWAVRRTFASLHLLFPLVTRALPLLLLFVTFLFINTEVWQVATSLKGGILWGAVLLFSAVAVGFLLVRLPEELDKVDDDIDRIRLESSCAGTPLESVVPDVASGEVIVADTTITGFQKANLVLVLLIAQVVQVLLLAVSVFLFFIVFGSVVMKQAVVESWIGHQPQAVLGLPGLTVELSQVAVFLAGFSGLYFTVYAVTDETYRTQFFTAVTRELERAVGARAVYRVLKSRTLDAG